MFPPSLRPTGEGWQTRCSHSAPFWSFFGQRCSLASPRVSPYTAPDTHSSPDVCILWYSTSRPTQPLLHGSLYGPPASPLQTSRCPVTCSHIWVISPASPPVMFLLHAAAGFRLLLNILPCSGTITVLESRITDTSCLFPGQITDSLSLLLLSFSFIRAWCNIDFSHGLLAIDNPSVLHMSSDGTRWGDEYPLLLRNR